MAGKRALRIFLLLYAKFVSRQFAKSKTMPILLFTDMEEGRRLAFNNLFAIKQSWTFLSSLDAVRCIVVVATDAGLARFAALKEVFRDNFVLFTASSLPNPVTAGVTADLIGTFPFETFSRRFQYENDIFRPYHLLIFLVVTWGVGFYVGSFFPKDDLLRHAVAYLWNYDYGIPYRFTSFTPTCDTYIGFDIIMGWLHMSLGDYALAVPQLTALVLTFTATNRLLKGIDNNIKLILLMFTMQYIAGRIMLGRPSIVCSSIMLTLYAYDEQLKGGYKVVAGIFMGILYYLSIIYFIPLLIKDRKYLISLSAAMIFWIAYSQGAFLSETFAVVASLKDQNLPVSENKTIIGFYFKMFLFALPMLYFGRRDLKTLFSILFLSLSNQVRYVETIMSLMVSFFRFVSARIRVTPVMVLGAVLLLFVQFPWGTQEVLSEIPSRMPDRSDVLTDDMNVMYQLIYRKPFLHVSPCYAYGWTDKEVQKVIKSINQGKLDCNERALYKFQYLVESKLRGQPPHCLDLVAVEQGRRLWKIRPPELKSNIPETGLIDYGTYKGHRQAR
ncbi:MAG: hypothetical protein M1497_00825 [Nitrospirae bacterium]|nr:hypothetical protein [Nitrospirota bacterium]MCL5021913.1 hypothetical protein [Nitrospirota bacterium]